MTEKIQMIPSRLKNAAVGGHVAGVEDIYDDTQEKTQQEINTEVASGIEALEEAIGGGGGGTSSLSSRILFVEKSLGKYSTIRSITLAQNESGKYVNTGGTTTSVSGYGISTPFTLNAGDILLVPSAEALPTSVSVVARIVTRTFQKVIGYSYAYRQDYPSLPLTATADYNSSLVYTAVYDETTETPTLTGWIIGGTTITTLPATREVTESYYEPLVKQSVSAMPSTGYYVYLCPVGMTVVVSGLTATVNGGEAQVIGWGIFKNICSNFVGAPGQSVIAQAFAQLQAQIDGLTEAIRNVKTVNAEEYRTMGVPNVLYCTTAGAPSASNVPDNWDESTMGLWLGTPRFIGQTYIDVSNGKVYISKAVNNSVNDWMLMN